MSPELFHGFRPDQIAALFGLDVDAFQDLDLTTSEADFRSHGLFQLVADHSGHSADAPERLTHLGDDPVNAGDETTRAKAAAAVAETDGMSQNEKDAYNRALTGPMKETTVKDLKMNGTQIIMADGEKGGVHAKKYLVDLDGDTKVKVFTYTYEGEDGKMYQETGYIFEKCDNPAVDASEDELAPVAPEPVPEVKPTVTYQVDPHHVACGDVRPLLLADIHVPNADPNSPEYQQAMHKALSEIQRIQGGLNESGYQKFTGVRVIGPDGNVLEVGCLENGSHEITDWKITQGGKPTAELVTASNYEQVIAGTLDNKGDGYVEPTLPATFDGKTFNVQALPQDKWIESQLGLIEDDIRSDGTTTDTQYSKLMNTPIPPDFLDWTYTERVKWVMNTFGVSEATAKDFVSYVGAYSGDFGKSSSVIKFDSTIKPTQGSTFGDFLKAAAQQHYQSTGYAK